MDNQTIQGNSAGWLFFVKASFVMSVLAMGVGILLIPEDILIKLFLAMGTLFVISSSMTLSKTIRDEFEARKLMNKINEAQTNKLVKEYSQE